MLRFVLISVLFLGDVYSAHLPKDFKTCKKSAHDFKKCTEIAFQDSLQVMKNGIPSLNMQPIDPLLIEAIHIEGNGGKVDILQDYDNLIVTGFAKSKLKQLDMMLENGECKFEFEAITPKFEMIGHYKIIGKVLILAINGIGRSNITTNDLITKHIIDCERTTNKNGEEVLKVLDYRLDLFTKEAFFDFENLVDGNAQLSAEVLKVINDSAMEIFEEINADYGRTFAQIFKGLATRILNKVPLNEYYSD